MSERYDPTGFNKFQNGIGFGEGRPTMRELTVASDTTSIPFCGNGSCITKFLANREPRILALYKDIKTRSRVPSIEEFAHQEGLSEGVSMVRLKALYKEFKKKNTDTYNELLSEVYRIKKSLYIKESVPKPEADGAHECPDCGGALVYRYMKRSDERVALLGLADMF